MLLAALLGPLLFIIPEMVCVIRKCYPYCNSLDDCRCKCPPPPSRVPLSPNYVPPVVGSCQNEEELPGTCANCCNQEHSCTSTPECLCATTSTEKCPCAHIHDRPCAPASSHDCACSSSTTCTLHIPLTRPSCEENILASTPTSIACEKTPHVDRPACACIQATDVHLAPPPDGPPCEDVHDSTATPACNEHAQVSTAKPPCVESTSNGEVHHVSTPCASNKPVTVVIHPCTEEQKPIPPQRQRPPSVQRIVEPVTTLCGEGSAATSPCEHEEEKVEEHPPSHLFPNPRPSTLPPPPPCSCSHQCSCPCAPKTHKPTCYDGYYDNYYSGYTTIGGHGKCQQNIKNNNPRPCEKSSPTPWITCEDDGCLVNTLSDEDCAQFSKYGAEDYYEHLGIPSPTVPCKGTCQTKVTPDSVLSKEACQTFESPSVVIPCKEAHQTHESRPLTVPFKEAQQTVESPSITIPCNEAHTTLEKPSVTTPCNEAHQTVESPSITIPCNEAHQTLEKPSVTKPSVTTPCNEAHQTVESPSVTISCNEADQTLEMPSVTAKCKNAYETRTASDSAHSKNATGKTQYDIWKSDDF